MGGAWDNLAYSGQMLKEFTVFFYFCRDGRRLLDDVFVKQLKVPNNKITTPQHFCIFHLFKGHEASIQKQNHSNIQLGPFFDYNHLKFKLKSICWGVSLSVVIQSTRKWPESNLYEWLPPVNDFPLWKTKCKTHSLLTIKQRIFESEKIVTVKMQNASWDKWGRNKNF